MTDLTGQESACTLDRNGFQLRRHEVKTSCRDDRYRDKDKVEAEYYPEMEQLLKKV